MRRSELEVVDKTGIREIIRRARTCHVGLCDNGFPYVFPVNFGFRDDTVYIHCALKGRKIDIIRKNPNACVEFVGAHEIIGAEKGCDWSATYESVIGEGVAVIVEDGGEKLEALKILMSQYSDANYEFGEKDANRVGIIRIELRNITGKKSERRDASK